MEQAAEASRSARLASSEVQQAAGDVSAETSTLGSEVDQFLALLRDSGDDRRSFERVPGDGRVVTMTLKGGQALRGRLKDLSRAGIAIEAEGQPASGIEPGQPFRIEITGASPLEGRVARVEGRFIALVLKRDTAGMAVMEQVIGSLGSQRRAA